MVKLRPLEKKFNWERYKYVLLGGVVVLIFIGIFQNQLRQIGTFLFGVTVDKAIDLGVTPEKKDFSILVLGIGGGTHDGPNLTDTLIYSHVSVEEKRVDMVSIPRDLWIDSAQAKINAIYAFGKSNGTGVEDIRNAVSEVVGEDIQYVLIIDFAGFVKLIDHLGGIEVDVERAFDDYEYPISGKENNSCGYSDEEIVNLTVQIATGTATQYDSFPCRYTTLSFTEGEQTMDGETALRYVRSRHGTNGEGSDFARSKRQQKVIEALKSRMLSLHVLLNPVKVVGAFNIIKDNIVTDIDTEKLDDFVKLAQEMQNGTIRSFVIDEGNELEDKYGLVMAPISSEEYKYQYVLIPSLGNSEFSQIHEYVDCIAAGHICLISEEGIVTPSPTPTSLLDR